MLTLINTAIGCLVGGALITLLLLGIVILIPKYLFGEVDTSARSYVCIGIATLFLLFQSTLMVGGIKAKKELGRNALTTEISQEIKKKTNHYIVRRGSWIAGGVVLSCLVLCYFSKEGSYTPRNRQTRHAIHSGKRNRRIH